MFDTFQQGFVVHPGDSFAALLGEDEAAILFRVHEEVLRQHGGACRLLQNREVRFLVVVAVGRVGTHLPLRECGRGLPVEDFGIIVGAGLAAARPDFPAGAAPGICVYRKQQAIPGAVDVADVVDAVRTLGKRYVGQLRHDDVKRDSGMGQHPGDAAHDVAVELVLEELRAVVPYGRPFARRFLAMAVVEKDAEGAHAIE